MNKRTGEQSNAEIRSYGGLLRRSLFVVLLFYCSIISHAQQAAIDSLIARLEQNLHDTDRVKTLNDLAWELRYTNPDSAFILTSEALSIAEVYDWRLGIAQSNKQLGIFIWMKGDFPKALEYHFKALKIDKELGIKNDIAVILSHIGNVYLYQGNFPKALEYYSKALKMFEELPTQGSGQADRKTGIAANLCKIGMIYSEQSDYPKTLEFYFKALKMYEEILTQWPGHVDGKTGLAATLGNIGNVYRHLGDYPKALEYYFKALKMSEELDRKTGIAVNISNIGIVYNMQGDAPKALEYYFKALKIDEELGDKHGMTTTLGNIANIYTEQHDYPKALEFYSKAFNMAEELGDKSSVARHLSNIGFLYMETGEFEKAEDFLQKGLKLAKEINVKEYLKKQYSNLSLLYDTTARPAQAFEAYKLYIIYRDSITNEENTKAQTRTEMKYEYEKAALVKEQEEKELARLAAEKTARRDNLQYSVVLICLLVIGVLVAMLGRLSLPERIAEGIIFFSFLILFEFLLVLADPYIDKWSGGAPGFKLLFNAGIAAFIFPLHSLFEARLKGRLVKE